MSSFRLNQRSIFSMGIIYQLIVFCRFLLASNSLEFILFHKVHLDIGNNIGAHVASRLSEHLRNAGVEVIPFTSSNITDHTLIMSIGSSSFSSEIITPMEISELPYEGYKIVAEILSPTTAVLVCNGRPLNSQHHNVSFNTDIIHYGAVSATYHCLELLGFGFLHPLSAYVPSVIRLEKKNLSIVEVPYWPTRIFHIHTQHPLELTEVLQGMDVPMFGPVGPNCGQDNIHSDPGQGKGSYCERWEDMVDDVNRLFEWAVANRQNAIEWLLLGNFKWGDFDTSDTRMTRLQVLTRLGHEYSLLVGADAPLGNVQQHAWYMVNTRLPFDQQVKQIRSRVDWIFGAGFDFISTESGLSEFTHPECDLMLDLLNEYARYVNVTWGREAAVKVHCSTGQTCDQFPDPRTGEPVNFNFLPMFAVPQLGVLPHTVQVYGLDDPTAGSYGNAQDFSYIEEYMFMEAARGNRSVVFYGETAYWVNVDVDVPLFLPLYGQRRLKDLQRIAAREKEHGHRIQGQMNFDSGWEWGYWINDFITARAAWNPHPIVPTHVTDNITCSSKENGRHCGLEEYEWESYATSLSPLTRIFNPDIRYQLEDLLVNLAKVQAELLVLGRVNGQPCPDLSRLSGIAYISGVDTWVDLPRMLKLPLTQPDKVHMGEVHDPLWPYVLPLLSTMERSFGEIADEMDSIRSQADSGYENTEGDKTRVNVAALGLLDELSDCMRLLALRASQVRMLYESSDNTTKPMQKASLQSDSRKLLATAATIVLRREQKYRVPWQRIASWRDNPTVYRFGYLWSVHSLYYWWRDQGLAEQGSLQSERSPCYLNRMDASEVAIGWGKYTLELLRNLVHRYMPYLSGYSALEFLNCIAPPAREYLFPQDLYHY